jgi:heat shock protein HslJ
MRRILVGLLIAASPLMAKPYTGLNWTLMAIDGQPTDIPACLQIDEDGRFAGTAPCNSWAARNATTLPAVHLTGLRATRRACTRLADEKAFFDALSAMTAVVADSPETLILTGPNGRSLKFGRAADQGPPNE